MISVEADLLTSKNKRAFVFVCTEDSVLGNMIGIVDVLHQDILGMTLDELDLTVSLGTGAGASETHPGIFSLQFLK